MKTHRKQLMHLAVGLLIVCVLVMGFSPAAMAAAPDGGPKKPVAKNIIVMIADGRGFNHLTAASYYEYGKADQQVYTNFPVSYAMSTYSYYCNYDPTVAWQDLAYVESCFTDSAAAATAMAAGVKTYNAGIGVDVDGIPVKNVLEAAEEHGKATGVITSVEWTHATPAGFVAHNVDRNNYAEIGQEMVYTSTADVVMGGGHPCYDADGVYNDCANDYKYVGGQDTWDALVAGTAGGDADGDGVADPWTLVQTREEFQALMQGPTPKRVLGTAQVYQTLQQGRSGDASADPYVVPLIETVPTLEEMTKAALNILDDDPDGLFLMIEGGAVDWAAHDNQSGRMIEEHVDFDNAAQAVVDWVQANSDWSETLLIVTNDHETGYLTGSDPDPAWTPVQNNGEGNLPGMQWHSENHTNSLVPLFANGDAARGFRVYVNGYYPVRGPYIDNTNVADVVFWAMDSQ